MEINIIPKFLDSALTPVAKEAGERLADIVSLVFTPVVKAKAKRDKNIELFLKEIDNKVKKIPEEKLQNPPLHIVGPIIDNVFKFYHDEEYLRAMYSTLIASSMDLDNIVHPSYIEIIRQLSSVDASVFCAHISFLFNKECEFAEDMNSYLTFGMSDIYFDTINMPPFLFYLGENGAYRINDTVVNSMQNLIRLGLLYVNKQEIPVDIFEKYNILLKCESTNLYVYLYGLFPTNFGLNFAMTCCSKISRKDFFEKNVDGILKTITYKDEASLEYTCQ